MNNELLTAEQLAVQLGVKPRTVKAWLQAGLIPATRLTAKVIRYDLNDVVAALKESQDAKGANDAE
jgi:excisionase family DNA binding protein